MLKLDTTIPVENYEIRLFRSDYTHIPMYLCRVSFLITLDIYKDYFKGRCACIMWSDAKSGLVHYSLCKSYCIFMSRVLWPRKFLKNFAANIFFKLVSCHVLWFVHWTERLPLSTSPIGYWGKGSIVGWYFGIGQRVW